MGVGRTWVRGLTGAVGAAVLVPLGLLLAVALAATVGGGGVGGLGQIVGGPTLPGVDPVVGALPGPRGGPTAGVPQVPDTRIADRSGSAATRTAAPSGGAGGSAEDRPDARRPTVRSPGGDADRPTDDGPDPPATAPPAGPVPTPTAPTAPQPSPASTDPVGDVVRGVGEVADQAVRPLPVVGPPAADAVSTVVDLVAPPRAAPGASDSSPDP